jgi:PAS domain S-box-containing protein
MDCMDEALAQLGRAADVSRCYIFANHADAQGRLVADQRFEWCAPGTSAQINNPDMQSMQYSDDLVRVADTLKSGRDFFCNAADLSPSERRLLDPQEVVSLLLVPIIVRGAWWGFIGFDECRRPREWDLTEREALRVAAGILGAAIEQLEALQAFYSNELAFRSVFSMVVEGFSQTTPDGRYLKANPALAKLLGYDSPEQLMAEVSDIGRQLYVRPEDRERYKRILEEKGFINGFEADFRRRDGSTVRVSIDAGAVRDASGRVEYYFSSNREIASRASTSRSV